MHVSQKRKVKESAHPLNMTGKMVMADNEKAQHCGSSLPVFTGSLPFTHLQSRMKLKTESREAKRFPQSVKIRFESP